MRAKKKKKKKGKKDNTDAQTLNQTVTVLGQ